MYSSVKSYTKEFSVFGLLFFACLLNYFLQQVLIPFLLPINIILFVYLILNKFNIPVLSVILCAILDEQLLGYYFGSLATIYSFICFVMLNCNKYTKFTIFLSVSIWFAINYNTRSIVEMFMY